MEVNSGQLIACSSCTGEITFGVFFCPHCGSAQLQAMLTPGNTKVAAATTAHYDPLDPLKKPWRETDHMLNKPHPKLPPQLGGQGQLESIASVPWRPTMSTYIHGVDADKRKRQLERIKRKELILKNSNRKLITNDQKLPKGKSVATSNGSVSEDGNGNPIDIEKLPPGHHGAVVYFKQHAFQRRHGKRKPAVPRQLDPIAKKAAEEALSDQHYEKGEQVFVHPVSAYAAEWLVEPGFTVHVSLIDRHHDDSNSFITRYFLRVGVIYEHIELFVPEGAEREAAEPEEVVTCSDLMVLEVLQNDISLLLTHPKQYWVDLNLIKPDEYYMSTFLQQSLAYIAQRVHASPSLTVINLIDQVCLVEPVYETVEQEIAQEVPSLAVITEQDLSLFKRRHKRALKRQKRANAAARAQQKEHEDEAAVEEGSSEKGAATRPGKVLLSVPSAYPDLPPLTPGRHTPRRTQRKASVSTTQLSVGTAGGSRPGTSTTTTIGERPEKSNRSSSVALGPPGREVNLVLEKTIAQRACRIPIGQIWEDQQVLGMVRLSVRYPDAEQLLHDELPKRKGEEDVLFSEIPSTQIVINVLPMYSPVKVYPKMISFDTSTLKVLFGENLDVDAILKEGFEAVNSLLRRIVELFNFYRASHVHKHMGDDAVVEEVYKLGITGVGTVPFDKPPASYDSDSDSEEVAGRATVECLAEVANVIIKDVCTEVLVVALQNAEAEKIRLEEERLKLEALHKEASTKIQTQMRGKIVRSQMIISKKRGERKELKRKAIAGALAMQCCVRKYLSKCRVSRIRHEQARSKLEAEMASKWVESMGLHLEVEADPDNVATEIGSGDGAATDNTTTVAVATNIDVDENFNPPPSAASTSPNKDAIDAWRDAYEKRSREGSPEKPLASAQPPQWDHCPCHGHPTYRYETELKDTPFKIAGLYKCSGICEHSIRGDRAAIKTMYKDANSMLYIMSKGDGSWELTLTVVEVPDAEEATELTLEEITKLSCEVKVDGEALEEIAANLHHEITMMAIENAEKNELDKEDAIRAKALLDGSAAASLNGSVTGSRRGSNLSLTVEEELQWAAEEKQQYDWEQEQEKTKTEEQLAKEAAENAKMIEADEALTEEEQERKGSRMILHNLLLNHEHKKEIFRRACAGITVGWCYDGALEAKFDLETVMDMYEVFYDDEGDLVVGI